METYLIDYLYYPHEQNMPCDEYVASQRALDVEEDDYEWLD